MRAAAQDTVAAVFPDHLAAEAAVKALTAAGVPMKAISIVGKGYHNEEAMTGFYATGDRLRFWGSRGAFWGGLWSVFFGGVFLTIPATGPVILLGYLAAAAVSAVEGAVMAGGLSTLGGALASVGIPRDSVPRYEAAIAADEFLVMAHGTTGDMAHAEPVLRGLHPSHLELHWAGQTAQAASQLAGMVV